MYEMPQALRGVYLSPHSTTHTGRPHSDGGRIPEATASAYLEDGQSIKWPIWHRRQFASAI
ncbi:hypothetical protein N7488_006342 [Penicillium malachiteum]|nr:hypothetical protein N7488_006342 [Penicillium malachiteum]